MTAVAIADKAMPSVEVPNAVTAAEPDEPIEVGICRWSWAIGRQRGWTCSCS